MRDRLIEFESGKHWPFSDLMPMRSEGDVADPLDKGISELTRPGSAFDRCRE